jgi:hypothetical protein
MGGTLIYLSPDVQLKADHNLYYNPYREEDVICADFLDACFNKDQINNGTWFAESGQDENGLYADPLFVDAANGDFHLSENSPAVDAGNDKYAPMNARIGCSQGDASDIALKYENEQRQW